MTNTILGKQQPFYCHEFTDNFCSSVALTKFLSKQGTYITETLRKERSGSLKEIITEKTKKGKVIWWVKDDVVVCTWKDKQDILTVSRLRIVLARQNKGPILLEAIMIQYLALIEVNICYVMIQGEGKQKSGDTYPRPLMNFITAKNFHYNLSLLVILLTFEK